MSTPITDLTCERVLSWIQVSPDGAHSSTKLDNLSASAAAAFAANAATGSQDTGLESLRNYAGYLSHDWRNLLTIILKLEWMVGRVRQREPKRFSRWMHRCATAIGLEPERSIGWSFWMYFAKSDIDMFLIELRSSFDYLAEIVGCIALRPCPRRRSRSYSSLTTWCEQSADAELILGSDLRDEVAASAPWFRQLRDLRDVNVHRGGDNIVFPTHDEILFLATQGTNQAAFGGQRVMHNDNVIDFRRFAALALASFWDLGEKVASIAFSRRGLPQVGIGGVRVSHAGLGVLRSWGSRYIES